MEKFLTREEFDIVMEVLSDKLTAKWDAIFGILSDIKQEMAFTHGALERIEKRQGRFESEPDLTRKLLLEIDDRLSEVEKKQTSMGKLLTKISKKLSK